MEVPGELNQSQEGSKTNGRKRRRLFCELVLDFTKNSTLHGLRYFTARGLTAVEKTFWIIIFLTSVVLCVWSMSNVWVKWQNSPIIISMDDHLMSASEVPFPAVTICPSAKIDQESFNYTKHWITFMKFMARLKIENVTTEDEAKERMKKFMEKTQFMHELGDVSLICPMEPTFDNLFAPYVSAQTLDKNIIQAAPDVKNVMWFGEWRKDYFYGTEYIAPVLTEDGLCFTFNGLAADEIFNMDQIRSNYYYLNATHPQKGWSLERGYFNRTGHDVYPRRGQVRAVTEGLHFAKSSRNAVHL